MLDSVSVMRLISWLETEYQISVPAEDVLIEHFGSLNQIKQYLDTRLDGWIEAKRAISDLESLAV